MKQRCEGTTEVPLSANSLSAVRTESNSGQSVPGNGKKQEGLTHWETRGASTQAGEFESVTEHTEIEVAKGVGFHAHYRGAVQLGRTGFVDVVE